MTSRLPVYLSSAVACTFVLMATDVSAQSREAEVGEAAQRLRDRDALSEMVKRYADVVMEAQRQGGVQPGGRGGGRGAPSSQAPAPLPSDPLTGPVVTNAPYSGDAVTTVTQILGDGTRIEQRTEAKFHRDSAGRIRREQTILGLPALNPSAQTVVTIDPTPNDGFAYTLDAATRSARRVPRASGGINLWASTTAYGLSINGLLVSQRVPGGITEPEQSLGTRQIEGVKATGRRTTTTIPTGQIGNDRPIEITDERWESPELKVLVYSRYSDPRTGVVEYRLTNISRAEPPPDLFAVPPDYTILDQGTPGGRTGGPRQGGPGLQNPAGRGADPRQ